MTKDQDRGNYAADVAVRASAERHASPVPPNFATDYQRDGKGFAIAEEDARNSVKGLKDRAPPEIGRAALAYAERGWPVFPVNVQKVPLTPHGKDDATRDPVIVRAWFARWPAALVSIATGAASGIVALDVDIRDAGSGLDSLEGLGIVLHPVAPTAHTPSGGVHVLFQHPGSEVRNSTGKIGRFLDVRGDGGSLILPPGPGRYWDPHLGPNTPLAPMPEWMLPRVDPQPAPTAAPRRTETLSCYAEAALDSAAKHIMSAPLGEQEVTLNRECFAIGQLAGGGVIAPSTALDGLLWAGRRVPSHDPRRPWRAVDIERKVKDAFTDGLREPRTVPDGRR